jgi:hypothetical protein
MPGRDESERNFGHSRRHHRSKIQSSFRLRQDSRSVRGFHVSVECLLRVRQPSAWEMDPHLDGDGLGKIKAIAQGTVIFLVLGLAIIYGEDHVKMKTAGTGDEATSIAHTLMWIVTAVTVWSGLDYFYSNRHLFFKNPQEPKS